MKTSKLVLFLSFLAAFGFSPGAGADVPLSLKDYLVQVRHGHAGIRAAELSSEGAKLYLDEANLAFRPTLKLRSDYTDDLKPSPLFSAFGGGGAATYRGQLIRNYYAGVEEQTPYGIKGTLGYNLNTTIYRGFTPDFISGTPTFDFTASLWQNFLGRQVVSQVEAKLALYKSIELTQAANIDKSLVEAENSYWGLALARESFGIAEAAVARAERLFKFSVRRVEEQLVDRSDSLQSGASLKLRQLDLKNARDKLRAASLAFNIARGTLNDAVSESLDALKPELFQNMAMPKKLGSKADVLAAEANARKAKFDALESREKNKPNLELYGTYALNSQELTANAAFNNSFNNTLPTKSIGLRMTMPLDIGTIHDAQRGYDQHARAQELVLERMLLEQERDWHDLEQQFGETKDKLMLTIDLEKAQLDKLSFEKERHMKGRTTLYQVLLFEDDYYKVQEQRVRALTDLLNIIAKMKSYGGRT